MGSCQSGDLARAMAGGSEGRRRLSRIARAGSSSKMSATNFRRPPHVHARASTSWTRFRRLRPVNTCRRLMDGGLGNVPGGDGGRARRSWVAARVREDWQEGRFDDSCDRGRCRRCRRWRGRRGGLSGAGAVFAVLVATRRPDRNDFLSPRRVRREHTVEPDQGVARRRDQRCQRGVPCPGASSRKTAQFA